MKKRLLSAALALAMVLTMLPLSVFAADPPTVGSDKPTKSTTVTLQTSDDGIRTVGTWYWTDTSSGKTVYNAVSEGVVSGTGNSGTWYSLDNDANTGLINANGGLKTTSFTLLSDCNFGSVTDFNAELTTLTVDVNGKTLTLPSNIKKLSSLTVSDRKYDTANSGKVSDITKTDVYGGTDGKTNTDVTALTLTANNVNVGTINLTNGRSNRVTLNGATARAITLNGSYKASNGSDTTASQTLTTTKQNVISGAITITGAGSQLSLANVTGTGGNATGAVTFKSTGGSVAVSGHSNVGCITITTNATAKTAAAFPTINISGGSVSGVNVTDANSTSSPTVNVGSATVGAINVTSGTINLNNGANVTDTLTVPSGALNISSTTGVKVDGKITLNSTGKTSFKVAGTNVETGDIKATNGSTLTVDIPNDLNNKFGSLSLTGYTGQGIKGGKFKIAADNKTGAQSSWFANTVRFYVADQTDTGYYRYYGENDLATALNYLGEKAATAKSITLVGHEDTKHVTLQNGATATKKALIGFSKPTAFKLPAVLLGDKITKWTLDGTTVSYEPTGTFTIDDSTEDYTLLGQDSGIQVNASKLLSAKVGATDAYTKGVRVTLKGNVITLSGAINTDGGMTIIPLTLETDMRKNDGTYDTVEVSAVYNSNSKTVTFGMSAAADLGAKGIILTETTLTMSNGGAVYTLNASGLGTPAADLKTYDASKQIQVTVNKSGWNEYQKKALADRLTKGGEFTWSDAPAMLQAVNAAQLTINNNTTLQNWVTTAQNYIWRYGNAFAGNEASKGKGDGTLNPHTTSAPTDAERADAENGLSKYSTVWLVPYLQVTVNDVNEATGYMTLTLTPSYRVDVSADTYSPNEYYTVQSGRSLGTISGDMSTGVKVKLGGLTAPLTTAYMHQDGTYAYEGANSEWTITHGGKSGLGSIVLNTTAPLIELQNNKGNAANPKCLYDSLQAAVDDTKYKPENEEDVIAISAGYTGTGSINVSGDARVFKIKVEGNTTITSSASGDTVKVTGGGHEYTIQLLKNVLPENAVGISVNTATGGSATVSSSSAKPGDTVTVTPRAVSGYKVSGVTAVTNTGASVPVKANSNGTYTFTVPANATKVTVTPRFVASENRIFPDVDPKSWYGPSVKYCYETTVRGVRLMEGDANGNFAPNAKLTRAQMVQMLYNLAGRPTVTGACPFPDVVGTGYDWAAAPITWAAQKGYVIGYSDGKFHPEVNVSRQDMVLILYRYAKQPAIGASGSLSGYYDASSVGSWAYDAVRWASSMGILSGTNSVALNGYINGPVRANRCEVAVTLANFHRLYG